MIEVLSHWNRWGTARLASGSPRDAVARVQPFLHTRDVVALVGPRRAGKTTVLFQLMDALAAEGVPPEAMLHVNFEEPALAEEMTNGLLDRLCATWRETVFPQGRGYLFFDEIQHVPDWERWVRARGDTEDIKIFVTGSSSMLMSRELGTLLTGRHVTLRVDPLSFSEVLRFRGIEAPARPERVAAPAPLLAAQEDFLRWGGFPEVVLATDVRRREVLLKQYFDDVLFKDVALRHRVRDLATLRGLAVHLLGQTAALLSFHRLANVFDVSVAMAQTYSAYLQEAYLVELLPYFSLKTAERLRRPQKVHAVDTGLRNAVCFSASVDRGRVVESAVHAALARCPNDGIYYWKDSAEVDLVLRQGNQVTELVQVTTAAEGTDALAPREVTALNEAAARFPDARRTIVYAPRPGGALPPAPPGIEVVPLWRFLLTR